MAIKPPIIVLVAFVLGVWAVYQPPGLAIQRARPKKERELKAEASAFTPPLTRFINEMLDDDAAAEAGLQLLQNSEFDSDVAEQDWMFLMNDYRYTVERRLMFAHAHLQRWRHREVLWAVLAQDIFQRWRMEDLRLRVFDHVHGLIPCDVRIGDTSIYIYASHEGTECALTYVSVIGNVDISLSGCLLNEPRVTAILDPLVVRDVGPVSKIFYSGFSGSRR